MAIPGGRPICKANYISEPDGAVVNLLFVSICTVTVPQIPTCYSRARHTAALPCVTYCHPSVTD
jgi:hypothetical protein